MGDDGAGMDTAVLNQADDIRHIRGNAACGAYYMDAIIMNPVQIQRAGQLMDRGTGEKVDAAVFQSDFLRKGKQLGYRNHHKHVVKAAVRQL